MNKNNYDIAIIGGGPAGLSAAIYAARTMSKTVLFESGSIGGLILSTDEIDNYPAAPDGSTGYLLTQQMLKQAIDAGCEIVYDDIIAFEKNENNEFILKGANEIYVSGSVIIASGSHPRLLGVDGELELRGRGVSYCATCDAGFFKNKNVFVIGGGDSALKEADYLTRFASSVTVVHRRKDLRASDIVKNKALGNEKISVIYESVVQSINGKLKVESITLKNVISGEISEIHTDGVFIFAGYVPNSSFKGLEFSKTDDNHIITNEKMETDVKGIFACGDVRNTPLMQVITAAADGAIAANSAFEYLNGGNI